GKNCVKNIEELNMDKARYLNTQLEKNRIYLAKNGAFFNEFVINLYNNVSKINKKLLEKGIIGGYDLGVINQELNNHMLVAVTEIRTKEEINAFVKELGEINNG